MSKRTLFAAVPMFVLAGLMLTTTARADDDLLSRLAASELDTTAQTELSDDVSDIDDAEFGLADVEALLGEGEEATDSEEAVAACYRRFGRSYGYRNYGYSSYRYSSYYTPIYRTHYHYTPSYCYTPVTYSYYTPVYTSYWGCW
ncbi:hypothetical protein [Aporhodopirellula aestuarii]|uniref:Uncharacterized protein n=1 Tax=Aporhodopirellula aestuarii TaxID=2950107 RepID=A0ABT0U8J5_9BACT|nr:hypothetical protein [Aporhodopirellula aestuarii]MCM2373294.1 hypothetical protein [Aporhodopirellula aestuarii]